MKSTFLLVAFFASCQLLTAQINPVVVTEQTIKIGTMSEEIFYFGFAEGDQLIFSFEEIGGKELKEVEIIELPGSSKFMDFKTAKIENKNIQINQTGIYKFRFSNSAVSGRICKILIQRIPANETTKNFNSSVFWKTVYDTTYYNVQEDYLISKDTTIHNITDQVAYVHSTTNLHGNKTSFNFLLPENTVAWSYYVGVNQAGKEAFDDATSALAKVASPLVKMIPGYGPMAAIALGGAAYIAQLSQGEDIDFYIVNSENVNLFLNDSQFYYIKKGKVINDFSKMTAPLKGNLHFCLSNDNAVTAVSVVVKVTAISVVENWGKREVEKIKVTSSEEPYLK